MAKGTGRGRAGVAVGRLMVGNAAMRLGATLSGQLFAFQAGRQLAAGRSWEALIVGLVGACFTAATVLGVPFAGRLADVRGHAWVLARAPVLGAVSAAVATVVALAGPRTLVGAGPLLVARVVEGVGTACAIPTTLALFARATEGDPAARTRVMGGFEIVGFVGLVGGLLFAGLAWDRLGALALLAVAPVYAAAIPLLAHGAGRTTSAPSRATVPPMLAAVRAAVVAPGRAAFATMWLAANAVVGLWLQYVPWLLIVARPVPGQRLVGGLGGAWTSAVFVAVGALYIGGTAALSFFAGRWSRRAMLALATVGVVGMAVSLARINHGAGAGWLVVAAASIAAQGGMTPAALGHLGDLSEQDDRARGTAMGAYSFLLGVGQFGGALLGGPVVARWRFDGLFGLSVALGLLALAAVGVMPASRPVESARPFAAPGAG